MNCPLKKEHFPDIRTRSALAPIRSYVEAHHSGLRHAARLLGGEERTRLVERLVDALQNERHMTRQIRTLLDQLTALLTLEHVGDPDRAEAAFFALIDPCDPAVEEMCLLADGLRDALAETEAIMTGERLQAPGARRAA